MVLHHLGPTVRDERSDDVGVGLNQLRHIRVSRCLYHADPLRSPFVRPLIVRVADDLPEQRMWWMDGPGLLHGADPTRAPTSSCRLAKLPSTSRKGTRRSARFLADCSRAVRRMRGSCGNQGT